MRPWTQWSDVMRKRFGKPVRKISIDAGFSCPNRDGTYGHEGCIYCNNEAFSPAVRFKSLSIEEQIESGISRFAVRNRNEAYLAFFQPYTNTYAHLSRLEQLFKIAINVPDVNGIIVSTRPDCIDNDNVKLLREIAKETYVSVEIGVQSIYSSSLEWMRRGHDYNTVKEAVSLFADSGIDICLHVILGLPGEGRKEAIETAKELALLNYHSIKLHNFHVLKDTDLEVEHRAGRLRIPTLAEHIAMVADFLEHTPAEIAVQRISGDAPPNFLVEPMWCLDKNSTIKELEEEFRRRSTTQGYAYTHDR